MSEDWKKKKFKDLTEEEKKMYQEEIVKASQPFRDSMKRAFEPFKKLQESIAKSFQPLKEIKIPDYSLMKNPDIIREENEWKRHDDVIDNLRRINDNIKSTDKKTKGLLIISLVTLSVTIIATLIAWFK